jgi:3-deoxy-D-manno-octulosonic-acid transferase
MGFPYRSYDLGLRGLRLISPLASVGGSKVARGLRGRRGAARHLERWAEGNRREDRPLVWFHAPSVGEGLQARAVLSALLAIRPDVQVVFTHFSPSAEGLAERMPAQVVGYLPWDIGGPLRQAVEPLRPDLMVFTKTEVWPRLAREVAAVGGKVVLAAATLPPNAGRLKWPARTLLRPVFGSLDRVLAIDEEDAARFRRLGVDPGRTVVTGDPAIDSASNRAREADPGAPYLAPFKDPDVPTVVAGSTWEADEEVLLPAATRAREHVGDLRLIIAPHEPSDEHLSRLEARLEGAGWIPERLAAVEERGGVDGANAVLVDRVGVLAHLYAVGHGAYVGGGFHRHGLHSVLEPASAGVPVAFGPGHANARAAGDLIRRGGAVEVAGTDELARTLVDWFEAPERRRASGERAAGYIREHLGAARRSARILTELLPDIGPAGADDDPEPTPDP